MAAVRQRAVAATGGKKSADGDNRRQDGEERKAIRNERRSILIVLVLLVYLGALTWVSFGSHWDLPQPNLRTDGNKFSTLNARKHLKAITQLGIRHAGSSINDIVTRDVILKAVEDIKATASPDVKIEVSVQQPSGHFHLDFLGGMTHLYDNLTNVVVRLSRQDRPVPDHALLVNCHFDSALGSPAASDDAVSCSVLLETLRCLSAGPSPPTLKHGVVFLFNGAEEMVLPASHGFITQHPFAREVRAFLNLEAAGAGGKEILFQTGPRHPWLASAYARAVPYPHASVVAQEIFQSGVIPSDTDFRIFRDHGKIPGIDMAFFVNGYVYHTEYDTADRVPDGSIQRAGENIMALIKDIANSDLLADPGEDKHGKISYFDVLGLFMVHYPERIGLILNWATIVLCLVGFLIGGKKKRNELTSSYKLILLSVPVVMLSLLSGVLFALVTSLVTTLTGQTLSYYAQPYLVVPLFYVPTVLGMTAVQYWWRAKNSHVSAEQMDRVTVHANELILLGLLLIMTLLRLASSTLPFTLLIFPLIFRTFLWDIVVRPHCKTTASVTAGYLLFQMIALSPTVLMLLFAIIVNEMFVPLMGRSGAMASPDMVIAVVSSCSGCLVLFYFLPSLVHYSTRLFAKVFCLLLCGVWLVFLLLVLTGSMFPYSGQEPIRPKRLYFQHSQVNYHDSPDSSFSGIYIHTLDYRELNPLLEYVPLLREAREVDCEGLYCGSPSYLPIAHMLKRNWILPAPRPLGQSCNLTLDSVVHTSSTRRKYFFTAHFPHNARLHLQPLSGLTLHSWSLESFIPSRTPYGDNQGCYYVLYTRGIGEGPTRFWIEVAGNTEVSPALEIASIAIYINPPLSVTPSLEKIIRTLPEWVSPIAWTSVMDVQTF